MMNKTHDGLYIKSYPKSGYRHIVVCHDNIMGGLAYASVDNCIAGTSDESNIRRRLFRESRKMLVA